MGNCRSFMKMDPSGSESDSKAESQEMLDPMLQFEFAFNNPILSDRVLHIELLGSKSDPLIIEVITYHVSSLLLAAHSPFFLKLFQNGMRETQQKDVKLTISVSEKTAFIDVLEFMYKNTLIANTVPDLLGVLIIADKFEVTSCMRYCSKLLQKMPMTLENALLYLDLPASVLVAKQVQPLKDATKKYIVGRYKNFDDFLGEAMAFHLSAVEDVLGSEGLHVTQEDFIFDFILEWARVHYPKMEERQEILVKRLSKLICFPYMSCSKLKEALICPDFSYEEVSKLVQEALSLKVDVPYGQHIYSSKKQASTAEYSFVRRVHKHYPFKAVQYEFDQPCYVVYFNLKKEECENLYPSGDFCSQAFGLGGRWLCLRAQCNKDPQTQVRQFGLFVSLVRKSETWSVDIKIAVMNSSKKFECKHRHYYTTLSSSGLGWPNLLRTSWTDFISNKSGHFINGFLHIRVQLTIRTVLTLENLF